MGFMVFNVGDNIHVEKEWAYPLDDRSNVTETR